MATGSLARLSPGAMALLALAAIQAASPSSARAGAEADCDLTVTPSVVEVGDDFWVAGNFNNGVVYQVKGKDQFPGEDGGAVAFASTERADFRFRPRRGRGLNNLGDRTGHRMQGLVRSVTPHHSAVYPIRADALLLSG